MTQGVPPQDGRPERPASEPQHTHPLTPVIQTASTLSMLVVLLLVFGLGSLQAAAEEFGTLVALVGGVLVLGALLGLALGWNYLAWQRTEYFFDASGDFRLDSGVLSRQERRVTLSRLQSVDVVRPLLGRIFGMAAVRVEVAGGGDSRVHVQYLTEQEAAALRASIIARAAGVRHDAGEAPEVVLASVPTKDLALSLLLRSETVILALLTFAVVAAAVVTEGATGLVLILLTGGVPLLAVAGEFTRFFNFTVADSPDGLRLRFGLLRTEAQTVPPGRVQAIELVEPLLWRRRGWVRIRLNVAGQESSGEDGSQRDRVLLPVAPRPVANEILARVLPGVDIAEIALDPAPKRAHKRSWFQFSNLGVGVSDQVFVTRRGFLTKHTAVIPHARTQSVRVTQGPWERALDLASVHVDSTPGPVHVTGLHRHSGEARKIAEQQLLRAAQARVISPGAQWMTHNGTTLDKPAEGLEQASPVVQDGRHEGHEPASRQPEPGR